LSKDVVDTNEFGNFLNDVPKLLDDDRFLCEGPISNNECIEAIKVMKNEKSPGSDGLPAEFYKHFFHLFGNGFVCMLNSVHVNSSCLPPSQRISYISLLCKDKEKASDLANWRPISLLNEDYKILSKVLVNRLRKVLGSIVGISQTCAVPGRSVSSNLHLTRDIIGYCRQRNITSYLSTLDQSKAFDRVDHSFMFAVLEHFGFGQDFINWVKLLYNKLGSRIYVNRFLTDIFDVTRSMRQGCGLRLVFTY
jgi:Reverse transcriptase (RNA-dependent DNA polymerase)